ncbi:riboflavin biosynthesis protein RibT [Enterococcus sp. 10A9_DIV0425]|uniref:Riboflavin biosynthesis protein RibT n=1 Tax=Candidatus Enterococcus wittei TaxID=1987383 RepID=A0A2C9XPM6_9ENTE|nr:GNAT family N-acetyltransferase [Enterococcus sp. 10A9_DIV0425]OTP12165.1 riboflavin biosynthesis protein RibT [Enterococcus sp. 10A9_DIV0425]THE16140.1 GNAT family N-acetyltransferase [Enterococcus hirae]
MLTHYRKENRKIAMGLLSFHKKLNAEKSLLKEIDTYETENDYELFFFTPEGSTNIQGIIGVHWTEKDQMTVHDIALNPSYRGEKIGFQMLNELQEKYPDILIHPTEITEAYLSKWINETRKE